MKNNFYSFVDGVLTFKSNNAYKDFLSQVPVVKDQLIDDANSSESYTSFYEQNINKVYGLNSKHQFLIQMIILTY